MNWDGMTGRERTREADGRTALGGVGLLHDSQRDMVLDSLIQVVLI